MWCGGRNGGGKSWETILPFDVGLYRRLERCWGVYGVSLFTDVYFFFCEQASMVLAVGGEEGRGGKESIGEGGRGRLPSVAQDISFHVWHFHVSLIFGGS